MFNFACKSISRVKHTSIGASGTPLSHFLPIPESSLFVRLFTASSNQHSFTVSYLINSCGLSSDAALSASRYVRFKSPHRPNHVISFFKNHGFSQNQISSIIRRYPRFLLTSPEKTLMPKFEFFYSKRISPSGLVKTLSRNPKILQRSLINHIVPAFDLLKSILQSDAKASAAFMSEPAILTTDLKTFWVPAVNLLRAYGVAESHIRFYFNSSFRIGRSNLDKFRNILEEVKELGFDPLKSQFVVALVALLMNKLAWQRKIDAYKSWGWSSDEIVQAFVKYPWCMMNSEDKIVAVMELFVNELGWDSSCLAKSPIIISMSLENRIKPRIAVLQYLLSKGLIREIINWTAPFLYSEKQFRKKFVDFYVEEAPEILNLLKGVQKLPQIQEIDAKGLS